MKKTILFLLALAFILPAYGKDKLPVIGFTGGGYSLLPQNDYMIGYINKDGSVDWNKLNRLIQNIANEGAWGWREFPPWPTPDPEFKLDFSGGNNLALKIITVKPGAIDAGRIWIEMTVGKETKLKDPFGQLKGAIAAITAKYGPPENKGKYPEPKPIPQWVNNKTSDPTNPLDPKDPDEPAPPIKPEEIEKKETETKTKTWYIVIGAAIAAAAVFCFIKFPVITTLVLAVLLLAAAYIGYKKKWKYYYVYLITAYAIVLATGILTNNPAINKVFFGGAMGAVAALCLIIDNLNKKIKELKKQEVKHE